MKMFFRSLTCFFAVLILLVAGCTESEKTVTKTEAPSVTGTFDFTVLKSGQADAIVLKTENHSIIIDCGEKDDGDEVVEYLQKNGISRVDYLFITHFDKDHVGGFPEVAKNLALSNIFVPDYIGNNSEYEKYLEAVTQNNLPVTCLESDTSFVIDDVLFEVSVPKRSSYAEGDNDFSLVISVTHGENTFLFAGDAERDRLAEVLTEFGREHDFIKIPHHGKYNTNTKRLISMTNPDYAVVCDSDKHPAEDMTMAVLKSAECDVYSTRNGDINIFSDGKEIRIEQ